VTTPNRPPIYLLRLRPLVLVPTDTPTSRPKNRLTKTAQIALRALTEAVDDQGTPAPASPRIPANVKVTTIEAWRQQAYRMNISTGEQAAKRKAFHRASEFLIAAQRIGTWDELAWLA
jgi:hypothetical protein